MPEVERRYFQLEQARQVADTLTRNGVDFLFIGKGGAIILGYPAATQDVDIFPRNDPANAEKLIAALTELGFELTDAQTKGILERADFVQLGDGPFDLDLVFAPDGIESFDEARSRMILIDNFPVAHIRDIIASKRASGRDKDRVDLPLLEDFREEFEKTLRGGLKSAVEIALERTWKEAEE